MPRAPKKPSSAKAAEQQSTLLGSLKFVGSICKEIGPINETHVFMAGHWVATSNGVTTIATKIQEDIYACPHAEKFIQALAKCKEGFAITQLEKSVSIKSGKFKAVIPCIDPNLMTIPGPDAPAAIINDNLRIGLEVVSELVNENGQEIVDASILLNGSTVVATDRKVMIEYWHGLDLPRGISIPKSVVKPLSMANKKLAKLGISQSSLTFYFEDESWIKTQLFAKTWPDIDPILSRPSQQQPFPAGFWDGIAAIDPFGDGIAIFEAGMLRSRDKSGADASFDVPGLPAGPSFPIDQLALIKPLAKTVDFLTPGHIKGSTMLTFFGDNVRGAIAGRT